MAVRNFNGSAGFIRFGQAINLTGAFSIFSVVKRNVNGAYHAIFAIENAAGSTVQWSLELSNANLLDGANNTQSATNAGIGAVASDGWVIVGFTKGAGLAVPRLHVFGPGGWLHLPCSTGSRTDQASITSGRLVIGQWKGSDQLNARVAAVAAWQGTALSDAQVETLSGKTRADWIDIGGVGACTWGVVLDQASTATPVVPFVGDVAGPQTAITGTSVVTTDDPPSTVFDLSLGSGTIYARTGAAEAPFQSSGADQITTAETGSGVTALEGSGARAVQSARTGLAVSARGGSGVSEHVTGPAGFTKTGIAVMGVQPTLKTGTAISARSASGSATVTPAGFAITKTGAGITPRTASGSKALSTVGVIVKSGLAVMGALPTSKTGTAVTARVASGASETHPAGIINAKSGGGAGGSGTPSYGLLSLSTAPGLKASGVATVTITVSKTGTAITGLSASGSKATTSPLTYSKSGSGVTAWTASGPALVINIFVAKTGSASTALSGSGSKATTMVKSGIAITPRSASGTAKVDHTYAKAGLAITARTASGSSNIERTHVRSGLVIAAFRGSGSSAGTTPDPALTISPARTGHIRFPMNGHIITQV